MKNKKRRFILKTVILSCLFVFTPVIHTFAEDNGGGNITTPGKVTFEVEKTEDSTTPTTTTSTTKPGKVKVTGKKFLPKTGEDTSFSLNALGAILIFFVGAYSYLHRRKEDEGGEQL